MGVRKKKIGLLAGSGKIPLLFIKEASKQEEVISIGLKGITCPEISRIISRIYWLPIYELDKCIKVFKKEGVWRIVMLGKIEKNLIFKDLPLSPFLKAFLGNLKDKTDSSFFQAFFIKLKEEGMEIINPLRYLFPFLMEEGVLSVRSPDDGEWKNIKFGWMVAKKIAALDIGQTVVVKDMSILAIEAIEGTDRAILRGGRWGGKGVIVIKVARPEQDMRFDIPTAGLRTLQTLVKVKGRALVLEAKKVFLMDREEVTRLANEEGISIIGIK